jgi:hypothetical protein
MKKDIDTEIVEWSIQAFPDLTMEKQLVKLEEELTEIFECFYKDDIEGMNKEFADVYIVSRILKNRFNSHLGGYFCGMVEARCYDSVIREVKKKMKKNKARVWEKQKDGTYHHKEEK